MKTEIALAPFIERLNQAKAKDEQLNLTPEEQAQIETAFWGLWDDCQNHYPYLAIDMGFNTVMCWVVAICDAAGTGLSDAPRLFYTDGKYCRAVALLEAAEALIKVRPLTE